MKLIVRVDDVGYTSIHNLGTWKTIEEGIATSADVMLDTPGTEDALRRLRDYPWISVGWHSHLWGSPVLPASEVPTLVGANGHFRHDLSTAEDVSFDEALKELRTELFRCVDILGRAPCCREFNYGDTPLGRAMDVVVKEFGIATDFLYPSEFLGDFTKSIDGLAPPVGKDGEMPAIAGGKLDDRWKDRKIHHSLCGGMPSMTDSLTDAMNYDPLKGFFADQDRILNRKEDEIAFSAWHPGYVDYYVMREGDHGFAAKNYILCRPVDVEALCDVRLRDWVIENKIELVNFHDALYGTRDYQNHLRHIGSPLAI